MAKKKQSAYPCHIYFVEKDGFTKETDLQMPEEVEKKYTAMQHAFIRRSGFVAAPKS